MGKNNKKISLYTNLVNTRQTKKDLKMRKRAKYLASLPKNPVKRFLYRINPIHFFPWLFSKDGAIAVAKLFGILALTGIIIFFTAILYFRRDLKSIEPAEINKRVQTTVNTYLDRNGKLLWKDRGDGDYKLVVKSEDINDIMKKATVAIEDRSFYDHHGVSLQGLLRAVVNNLKGGSTQGGSTLTQQLVKQVFFADEAKERGIKGIPRKFKEMILATEIERLYNKDQIISMYLNESPYGGRRNGVESGAQTYFGKSAKDLTLAEAALLASIPNNPSIYNPYYKDGNEYLIQRQHKVLDDMVKMNYITQEQADEAKKIAILDTIKPEVNQIKDIKAPHFVLEARQLLESKFGVKTVRAGGLTIKTTVDLDAQNYAEEAINRAKKTLGYAGADNAALTSVDVKTGQVIAQVGSIDFNREGYGQKNAATSLLEPGSSIKPIIDYAPLFMQREGINYGPGSILKDENIDQMYCGGNTGACQLRNYTRRFYGNISIRKSLANSLNIPAVKAMNIVSPEKAAEVARELGDWSYCKSNGTVYLSAAIGGGCSLRQDEHTNAYASLARNGAYKPLAYILEVKNTSGEQLYTWKDEQPKQVIDPQSAFMVTDILSDVQARTMVFGSSAYQYGFTIPGVWTAAKTGTTENGQGKAKDSWLMQYSSAIATGVWTGNHDGSPLGSDSHNAPLSIMGYYMENVHKNVYAPKGLWKSGDKVEQPAGLKRMSVMGIYDLWPSWFQGGNIKTEELVFDKLSKKKATNCTPEDAKVKIQAYKTVDPITKNVIYSGIEDYDYTKDDDIHICNEAKPAATIEFSKSGNKYLVTAKLQPGTSPIDNVSVIIDGNQIFTTKPTSSTVSTEYEFTKDSQEVVIKLIDQKLYSTTIKTSGPDIKK